jgi:mannose-6-phosphate isomerase-like protein (cupin superfamily)
MQVRVTDRAGAPAADVAVTAEGPVSRDGVTDATGQVQFKTVSNGTYRLRASGAKFITLEKEVTVRAGATISPIEFALSAAPPPPAPPPAPAATPTPAPPVAPAAPTSAKAGESRVLSIADLAERSLGGRDPIKLVPVACSGLDRTQMIVLRDTRATAANAGQDEMLYVVAGEATLSIDGREQPISSGYYAMVPRGTTHSITRRGRNPVIILSTVGGQPCPSASSR